MRCFDCGYEIPPGDQIEVRDAGGPRVKGQWLCAECHLHRTRPAYYHAFAHACRPGRQCEPTPVYGHRALG